MWILPNVIRVGCSKRIARYDRYRSELQKSRGGIKYKKMKYCKKIKYQDNMKILQHEDIHMKRHETAQHEGNALNTTEMPEQLLHLLIYREGYIH